ncbi:MAG: hypothetical protein PWR16_1941 [Methanoculleus sp.]|nr:hypothetical protein [Methanoculleus sp.]
MPGDYGPDTRYLCFNGRKSREEEAPAGLPFQEGV